MKYESFSSWQQSYFRTIGYFEGIYTCENLTFHLQTEKEVQCVSEMVCFTQCIHSLKIAKNIYRCIKNSADMMLTNEIEHYMQQWNYIKIRQAKTKN